MYPGDVSGNGLPVPRKASLFPPWVASQLPSVIASQSEAYRASRFATPISDTEDEALAPRQGDKYTCADDMQIDSRATSQACLQFDPLRAFSAAKVCSDQCLARILKEGEVRQCQGRPKEGTYLCHLHTKQRGNTKNRYGKVTEDVPSSMVPELQEKVRQVYDARQD